MMRITADWITHAATQSVCQALTQAGAQVFFVGGCVRNSLLSTPVSDIDLATDATPETVIALAQAAGIKAIPTGIAHGTVTLVKDTVAHEVTTFRRDIATDGRRAIVSYSNKIAEDAARRDFTMNALYAHPDGTVIDPLNGLPDLIARRVRFIGSADDRIREDYLRSLRYFRFHAWYGDQSEGPDPEALAAITANLDGLATLSRERVGGEFLKLLAASDPAPSVAAMRSAGVLTSLLPGADDRALALLVHLEAQTGMEPDPLRRLALFGDIDWKEDLRVSRSQNRQLSELRMAASGTASAMELAYRSGPDMAHDAMLLRCALLEQPWDDTLESQFAIGASAQFPISPNDLMPRFAGAALGQELGRLENVWIASGFTSDKATLLRS